jgi:hypothetical protein
MAELRRAKVSFLPLVVLHLVFVLCASHTYKLVLAFAGVAEEGSCAYCCWCSTITSYCSASSEGSIPLLLLMRRRPRRLPHLQPRFGDPGSLPCSCQFGGVVARF